MTGSTFPEYFPLRYAKRFLSVGVYCPECFYHSILQFRGRFYEDCFVMNEIRFRCLHCHYEYYYDHGIAEECGVTFKGVKPKVFYETPKEYCPGR